MTNQPHASPPVPVRSDPHIVYCDHCKGTNMLKPLWSGLLECQCGRLFANSYKWAEDQKKLAELRKNTTIKMVHRR